MSSLKRLRRRLHIDYTLVRCVHFSTSHDRWIKNQLTNQIIDTHFQCCWSLDIVRLQARQINAHTKVNICSKWFWNVIIKQTKYDWNNYMNYFRFKLYQIHDSHLSGVYNVFYIFVRVWKYFYTLSTKAISARLWWTFKPSDW